MWEKLVNVDRRVIYGVVFLSLSIPLIWPIGFEVAVGPETKQLYDMVNNLPEGSAKLLYRWILRQEGTVNYLLVLWRF